MKLITTLLLFLFTIAGYSANPSFADFNTNQFSTAGNKVTSKGPFTNDFNASIGHYARLVNGTTNSLKVLTNGLQGIAIGDVNIAASAQGWPFNGFTYISYLDGGTTPAHDYNAFAHGTFDSVGGGGDMLMEAVSNGGEKCTINLKTKTNSTIASAMEVATKKQAAYIIATDSFGSPVNAFGVQNIPISSTATIIGETNLLRFIWNSSERIALHTNGNLTIAGLADVSQVVYRPRTISGAGNGSTNYTILTDNYKMFLGSSNVNILAGMQTVDGQVRNCSVSITNLSADTWGISFSSVTNRWRFHGLQGGGTNAPTVLTNNTELVLNIEFFGTNGTVEYKYLRPAL